VKVALSNSNHKSEDKTLTPTRCKFLIAPLAAIAIVWLAQANGFAQEATLSFSAEQVAAIDQIVLRGIEQGEMPGAVVVIADRTQVLLQRAYGDRQIEPTRQPMTLDTVFDLASLTKPIATATAVARLSQAGKIEVDRPVSEYLPEFAKHGKEAISVADLLLHVGGLIPDNALRDYEDGTEQSWLRICDLQPLSAPGEKFAYSDVGFIVLGELVRRVSGKSLDVFTREEIFQPLGMHDTMFNPSEELKERTAPTEQRDGHWIKGEVHDPRAHLLGGVAGHAGLFSTAGDLARFGQMLLQGGSFGEVEILTPPTLATFAAARKTPRGTRTYGWDHQSPYSNNRGKSFSHAAFGHGGFTGTVMWIDLEKQRIFLFLSNRLHPDGQGTVNSLAGEIATIVGQ
jgi:serine-type D-Ala-D-Ala carboxypeptidase